MRIKCDITTALSDLTQASFQGQDSVNFFSGTVQYAMMIASNQKPYLLTTDHGIMPNLSARKFYTKLPKEYYGSMKQIKHQAELD